MTAKDLIRLLKDVDPDTEVRLAQQPHWPFEYSIGEIAAVAVGGPEEGDTVTYDDGSEHTGVVKDTTEDGVLVEQETGGVRHVPFYQLIGYLDIQDVVYIGEGTQLGYLPGAASRELGWG
jgi:hypothetical protein